MRSTADPVPGMQSARFRATVRISPAEAAAASPCRRKMPFIKGRRSTVAPQPGNRLHQSPAFAGLSIFCRHVRL